MIMVREVGVFLHSFGKDLYDAVHAAGKNGLGFKSVQLGPLPDKYFKGTLDEIDNNRRSLVKVLSNNGLKVNSLCVCYEHGDNEGVEGEEYAPDIERIANTGGYGIVDTRLSWSELDMIRNARMKLTMQHIDLAADLRKREVYIDDEPLLLTTHFGFIDRENQRSRIDSATDKILQYAHINEVRLGIESGSETMESLVGFIRDAETRTGIKGYLGVNFDPANHLLYGTQDPMEALEVLNKDHDLLFGYHWKDATEPEKFGAAEDLWKAEEAIIGEGYVDFEKMATLLDGFTITQPGNIEREGGKSRKPDIRHAKNLIEAL